MDARTRQQLLQTAELHFRAGDAPRARQALEQLVAQPAAPSRAFELLGYVHGNEGRLAEAQACLERACQLPDASPEAHYYRGVALLRQGQADPALQAFDRSLALAGPFFEALHERATACSRLGRYEEALQSYLQAARFRPDTFELVFNLAKVYDALHDFRNALVHYDRALALDPSAAQVWAHRGALLHDAGRWADAIESWERALAIDPQIEHLRGHLLHTRLRLCDWRSWEADRAELLVRLSRDEPACPPFELLAICGDANVQARVARQWVQAQHGDTGDTGNTVAAMALEGRRIRVGYFSADFGRHAVSHLIAELCEQHDREGFETFAFALNQAAPQDEMRARLERAFDHFIDLSGATDEAVVSRARSCGLDIAVDLGGHTKGSRTGIFRQRVAPAQVNYLGYPGTMGAGFIDYLIADEATIPTESREHYAERIVWLPDCFQPSDTRRVVAEGGDSRQAFGLAQEAFVLCCFNNSYKLNPPVFATWMRILHEVPDACLWLLADHESVARNLRQEAGRAGIDPQRLVFGGRLGMAEYLARYRHADLFLDTLPFNAGTTASDALFAGLPVLTCAGKAFAGRMAASLLRALDLPELVAASPAEYEATAIRLARRRTELRTLKERLDQHRRGGALFDVRRYARHLEAAYREMASRAELGLPPEHLQIPRVSPGPARVSS